MDATDVIAHLSALPEAEFVARLGDAACLQHDGGERFDPRVLSMAARPYVMAQPYWIGAFRDALVAVLRQANVVCVSGADFSHAGD